jgi:hypothetical protein
MAYSGIQVNGGMEVSQENGTSAVVVSSTKYILDGWMLGTSGAQVLPVSQQPNGPAGFVKSAYVSVSTANASPAAGNYCFFYQPIEGYRVSRLAWGTAAAQPITVSFWVATNRTGAFSGSIRNGAADRAYPFSFTMNAVGAWEYKTVSIPGDTTGTWAKDNTIGLTVSIALMCGSGQTAPANAWVSGGYLGVTGTTNGVASTTDYMYLTGLVVLPGTQAPTAAQSPNVMRSYDQELVTCKRYFQKMTCVVDVAVAGQSIFLAPEMRVIPTFTGGGTGFTINGPSAISPFVYQATRALTTLTMDARL